jgi:hypothetical protein
MKTRIALLLLPVLGNLATPAMARDNVDRHHGYDRVEQRLERQHWRIKQGVRSGELTRREASRLHEHHRRTVRMKHRFLHDGYLDHYERRKLHYRLDNANELIYRLKHNDLYRYRG